MSKSIDEDIEQTLSKLCTLLEYSTAAAADQVLVILTKAKALWDEQQELDN